ncbi:MAG: type II secretion system protein [Verrucomicrobiota bacterium]
MKNPVFRRAAGFTLIELLVVIVIIAVLAAAGFAAGNAALQRARRTKALSAATAMDQAITLFYSEYASMPVVEADDVEKDTVTDGPELLAILLGKESETADPLLNTRGIKFLDVKATNSTKDGIRYDDDDDGAPLALYDPWGGSYKVMMDVDGDEKIMVDGKELFGRRVATWTLGAEKNDPSDDVKTY